MRLTYSYLASTLSSLVSPGTLPSGLEVRVPINVFDVDVEEWVDDHFIIGG